MCMYVAASSKRGLLLPAPLAEGAGKGSRYLVPASQPPEARTCTEHS